MRMVFLAPVLLAILAATGATPVEWLSAIDPLPTPAGHDSVEPHLSVRGDRALLSWIEQSDEHATLKFAERTSTGWSEPR